MNKKRRTIHLRITLHLTQEEEDAVKNRARDFGFDIDHGEDALMEMYLQHKLREEIVQCVEIFSGEDTPDIFD